MKIFRLALILTLMLFFREASGAYLHMRNGLHSQHPPGLYISLGFSMD